MTKMQASEIEQLDNKCFDLFAGFFCKCSARNYVFDPCSSIIEYSFQNPTMNLTVKNLTPLKHTIFETKRLIGKSEQK